MAVKQNVANWYYLKIKSELENHAHATLSDFRQRSSSPPHCCAKRNSVLPSRSAREGIDKIRVGAHQLVKSLAGDFDATAGPSVAFAQRS